MQEVEKLLVTLPASKLEAIWNDPKLGLKSTFGPIGDDEAVCAHRIVSLFDTQLFAQKSIRDALLEHKGPSDRLIKEFNKSWKSETGKKLTKSQKNWKKQLCSKWHPGGPWAKVFCRAFSLDLKYAGVKADPKPQRLEVLEPHEPLADLENFQQDLSDRIYKATLRKPAKRYMATLPTGAGKTRTMMDAILRYQSENTGIVLWIATTQEVCEQAAQAYKRCYENYKPAFGSALHRFWGDYKLEGDFSQGLLVAGIQKLRSQLAQNQLLIELIKKGLILVVFDEAHHATAPTYKETLETILSIKTRPRPPLIGLTATPGKGIATDSQEVQQLIKLFDANLIQSQDLKRSRNPVQWLQRQRVLSKLTIKRVDGAKRILLNENEVKHMDKFSSFSPGLLHRIGQLEERNQRIIQHGNRQQKTLVFACDVAQAEWLAHEWRSKYNDSSIARAITATTPYTLRRKWLSDFITPESSLNILVNVGVLTTGFDAPKVERLILARPTMSRILFEQMVGRGLRGPKFGGYPQCTVIDVVDNFTNFGTIKSAKAFEKDWLHGKRLQS